MSDEELEVGTCVIDTGRRHPQHGRIIEVFRYFVAVRWEKGGITYPRKDDIGSNKRYLVEFEQ